MDGDDGKFTMPYRAFIVFLHAIVGMLVVSLVASACIPVDGGFSTPDIDDGPDHTPTWSAPTPDLPTAPVAITPSSPEPLRTETLQPVLVEVAAPAVCDSSPMELSSQGDRTEMLGNPLTSWRQTEKDNIMDAAGLPIFPDVLRIAQNGAAAGLVPIEVAVGGEQVGGYSVVFTDSSGNYIWPKVQDNNGDFVPAARPDANGMITPNQWHVVPSPEFGQVTPWMQAEGDRTCVYLVSTLGDGTVAGRYEPLTNTWIMEEGVVSDLTCILPLVSETHTIRDYGMTCDQIHAIRSGDYDLIYSGNGQEIGDMYSLGKVQTTSAFGMTWKFLTGFIVDTQQPQDGSLPAEGYLYLRMRFLDRQGNGHDYWLQMPILGPNDTVTILVADGIVTDPNSLIAARGFGYSGDRLITDGMVTVGHQLITQVVIEDQSGRGALRGMDDPLYKDNLEKIISALEGNGDFPEDIPGFFLPAEALILHEN